MKYAVVITTMLMCASATAGLKPKPEYRFSGDVEYAGFCKAVLEDDVKRIRSMMRAKVGYLGASYQSVARKLLSEPGVTCDGQSLVHFSKQRQANTVHAYLSKMVNKVTKVSSNETAYQR